MGLKIADQTIPSNSTGWVDLPVTEDVGEEKVNIPLYVINGAGEGPAVWVQGGVFGDEVISTVAIRDVLERISPEDVDGAIIGAPVVNTPAFKVGQRNAPMLVLDNKDLVRNFAPTPNETFSFHKLLTDALVEGITSHADYVVDMHSGRKESVADGFAIYADDVGETREQARELARHTGVPDLVAIDSGELKFGLFERLADHGIPSVVTVIGGESQVDEEYYERACDAVENVTRAHVLSDDPVSTSDQSEHDGLTFVHTSAGGFFESDVKPRTTVGEGDTLAEVTGVRGETKERIDAPHDGKVLRVHTFGTARPGNLAFILAP